MRNQHSGFVIGSAIRRPWAAYALAFFIITCAAAIPSSRVLAGPAPDEGKWIVVVEPGNSLSFSILHGPKGAERAVGHIGMAGWGPKWAWAGIGSKDKPKGPFVVSAPFTVNKAAGQVIAVQLDVAAKGTRSVVFRYDLTADKDVPLTLLAAVIGFDKSLAGEFTATGDGKETSLILPLTRGQINATSHATYKLIGVGEVAVDLDPAVDVGIDGDARMILAQGEFKAGHKSVAVTLTFGADVALVTSPTAMANYEKPLAGPDWYQFQPTNDLSPSVIGMENWLEKPAGKRGGVRMVGDHFQSEDGTPIKFWGTNLAYGSSCAPEKKIADFTAARFAKYGVNAVRLHKFTYPKQGNGIGDSNDSTKFDPAGLDRLDYFSSQLKNNGVYFGWSHTYGFQVRPGDRSRLLAYDEVMAYKGGSTYAFINFAPDVQDLMIESVVNLLKHKNPYTGLTYAEEPALNFIELQNEDDIFFYTSDGALKASPTYRKQFMGRFAQWLKAKYASEEGLKKAWREALKGNESLADGNIALQLNPWFFGEDHLPQTRGGEHQRLVDTALFLHAVQDQYYGRYVKAIRDAGYKGPINGSPWQAPSGLPHYLNLKSDYAAGYIDRHNYFGGKLSDTMLAKPGSGDFSSGLQQVIDRPFGLSEWIHVYPSLYSAEGPDIIAIYGMGLQGWDASYEFQSGARAHAFADIAGNLPYGVWDADTPTQIGQYPLLARMIYRGDVKESPVISVRRVSDADLSEGKFSFSDKVTQHGDIKSFAGTVPPEALAAGRCVVEFTPAPAPSTFPDMAKYRQGDAIVSSTGQLKWDAAKRYFTLDAQSAKALVGFDSGNEVVLGNVRIRSESPYVSILLTATDPKASLATGKTALLSAIARTCNTGFTVFGPEDKITNNGTSPILMEPVKATFTIAGRHIKAVNLLDHDGRQTGKTLTTKDGAFTIDGALDKTPYYEVVFE
ncbi:MAG TPA: hypothetical protein VG326_10235 [Tepidisphaeraceae bacterium]|jgi:hypothetical protein|nr:hypothetical protein [Tepidisphaeraceae bacterium]